MKKQVVKKCTEAYKKRKSKKYMGLIKRWVVWTSDF